MSARIRVAGPYGKAFLATSEGQGGSVSLRARIQTAVCRCEKEALEGGPCSVEICKTRQQEGFFCKRSQLDAIGKKKQAARRTLYKTVFLERF
jgi:hypothetical protein